MADEHSSDYAAGWTAAVQRLADLGMTASDDAASAGIMAAVRRMQTEGPSGGAPTTQPSRERTTATMAKHQEILFNGTVRAGAISFGDNQPVTGSLHEESADSAGERAARPERPARPASIRGLSTTDQAALAREAHRVVSAADAAAERVARATHERGTDQG